MWIGVERFDNGADVSVRVRFFADRPHEVEVAGFATERSVALSHLILTATMGNWARLRRLRRRPCRDTRRAVAELLRHRIHPAWTLPLAELTREGEAAVVSATGDEEDPWSVDHSADTAEHWRFLGRRAVQTWRVDDPHPELEAVVNARWSYWASAAPIPGGPAYENFEIIEPFRQGAAFGSPSNPSEEREAPAGHRPASHRQPSHRQPSHRCAATTSATAVRSAALGSAIAIRQCVSTTSSTR